MAPRPSDNGFHRIADADRRFERHARAEARGRAAALPRTLLLRLYGPTTAEQGNVVTSSANTAPVSSFSVTVIVPAPASISTSP